MRSTGEGGHLLYGNSAERRLLPRVSLVIAADSSHGITTVGALHACRPTGTQQGARVVLPHGPRGKDYIRGRTEDRG